MSGGNKVIYFFGTMSAPIIILFIFYQKHITLLEHQKFLTETEISITSDLLLCM